MDGELLSPIVSSSHTINHAYSRIWPNVWLHSCITYNRARSLSLSFFFIYLFPSFLICVAENRESITLQPFIV